MEREGPGPPEDDEDLPSVHKDELEPGLAAVQLFDDGMDDLVRGLKKLDAASEVLQGVVPEQWQNVSKALGDGLRPWVEAVDEAFQQIFPDQGEQTKG